MGMSSGGRKKKIVNQPQQPDYYTVTVPYIFLNVHGLTSSIVYMSVAFMFIPIYIEKQSMQIFKVILGHMPPRNHLKGPGGVKASIMPFGGTGSPNIVEKELAR